MKPILYIDVDGVLFGEYEGYFQLRPNVIGFLEWCTKYFDCRWLTCWGQDQLESLFNMIYGTRVEQKIKYHKWFHLDNKAKAIDLDNDFYWIEDGLPEDEIEILDNAHKTDRYIYVNNQGRDELDKIREILEDRLKQR